MNLADATEALVELGRGLPDAPGELRWQPTGDPLFGDALVIDNPAARGALTVGMMVSLARAVAHAPADPAPVLLVRGVGPAFCSGGHLGQVRAGLVEREHGVRMSSAMTVVLDALLALPRLVVAEVDGPALGGGAELLTACDHVACGGSARIGFVHARLGVAPGWGGAARLVRRIGAASALRVLGSAAVFDPATAVRVGVADAWDPDPTRALASLVDPWRGVAPAALRAIKSQVAAASPIHRTGVESARFADVWGGDAHRRALRDAPG